METDCPFLPPEPHRGQRNEPAHVRLTAARVAELRGADPEALAAAMTANAARLFRVTVDGRDERSARPDATACAARSARCAR